MTEIEILDISCKMADSSDDDFLEKSIENTVTVCEHSRNCDKWMICSCCEHSVSQFWRRYMSIL